MNTTNLVPQALEKQSSAGGTLYFPFANEELVQDVLFSNPTNYEIFVVEGFTKVSDGDVKSVQLGTLETACLVVKTTDAVKVKVLILKNE